jgi:hypothetical protein
MHKWISAEKLLDEWEGQNIADPYIFKPFEYE